MIIVVLKKEEKRDKRREKKVKKNEEKRRKEKKREEGKKKEKKREREGIPMPWVFNTRLCMRKALNMAHPVPGPTIIIGTFVSAGKLLPLGFAHIGTSCPTTNIWEWVWERESIEREKERGERGRKNTWESGKPRRANTNL